MASMEMQGQETMGYMPRFKDNFGIWVSSFSIGSRTELKFLIITSGPGRWTRYDHGDDCTLEGHSTFQPQAWEDTNARGYR